MAVGAAPFIPPRRLSHAEIAWVAFVGVQALDGLLSYVGVISIGNHIEANPLLAWYLATFGPATAFVGAKLFAIACGAVLYLTGRHHWLAGLTAAYLLFAVGPWVHVLVSLTHL